MEKLTVGKMTEICDARRKTENKTLSGLFQGVPESWKRPLLRMQHNPPGIPRLAAILAPLSVYLHLSSCVLGLL